jgi:hypothetical protein
MVSDSRNCVEISTQVIVVPEVEAAATARGFVTTVHTNNKRSCVKHMTYTHRRRRVEQVENN